MQLQEIKYQRFQKEITNLRQLAWGSEIKPYPFNKVIFDELDKNDKTKHWGVFHENELVGTCRLSVLSSIDELPYSELFSGLDLAPFTNFAFYSRLVIHPDFRGRGLANQLDEVRIQTIKNLDIKLTIATARDWRLHYLQKEGWKLVKKIDQYFVDKYKLSNTSILKLSYD
ncbi:MAG: hypothetical protein CMB99_06660 [Flavobacteriaceae bacterium]|nr:hypothetical protein [Flavobacteriaceae bacterium]|tara:strand:- start:100801 stop:101313 length:513 start_codon:yes stop_codon:yes gene_type:complete